MLTLIGHGTFDGTEYKFNLVGPDISGGGSGRAVRQDAGEAPADREYDERERRVGRGAQEARAAP